MSTERGWRTLLVVVITALVVASAALGIVAAGRGPRIADLQVAARTVVALPGQRAVLTFDEALSADSARGVQIVPSTPFTTTVSGEQMVLTFSGALHYATRYSITVPRAASVSSGSTAASTVAFTTAGTRVDALIRSSVGDDVIRSRSLEHPDDVQELYSAPSIQSWTDAGAALVVVEPADGTSRPAGQDAQITTVQSGTTETAPIPLPGVGGVRALRGQASADIVGYVYTPADLSPDQLWVYDFDDASGLSHQITGLPGGPASVDDWRWVPGTTSMVVRDDHGELYLVDAVKRAPATPLGSSDALLGVIAPGPTVWISRGYQDSVIDLGTGKLSGKVPAVPEFGDGIYPAGRGAMLGAATAIAQPFDIAQPGTGASLGSRVDIVDLDGTDRTVWSSAVSGERVDEVCSSPNDQLVAIATYAGPADSDEVHVGHETTTVYYVDVVTSRVLLATPGMEPAWC